MNRLKVKGWEKIFYVSGNQKKARIATLLSDKKDFKTKVVIRDKGCYRMRKWSVHPENIIIINIHACPISEHLNILRKC